VPETTPRATRTKDGLLIPLPVRQIAAANFQTWVVSIPRQYTLDDLLDPSLWRQVELAHQARTGRPSPGDLVRAIAEDGTFDAFFVIQAVERGYRLQYSHGRLPDGEH
jgi:hypothetical protein